MATAIPLTDQDGNLSGYMIFCPACKCGHLFDINRWTFNGDPKKPSFQPSMLVHEHAPKPRYHSFVTDGRIAFCPDSGHALAGQTVDLPDWDEMEKQPIIPCEECAMEPCCEDRRDNPNISGCLDGVRL